jgi:hypothetical protein
MKKTKTKPVEIKPTQPIAPQPKIQSPKAHKPAPPITFQKPPLTNPFAKGWNLRQDNRGKFFARTRRGGI